MEKAVPGGTCSWRVRAEASPEPWLEKLLDGRSGSSSVNVPGDSVCGCWLRLPCDLLRLMPEPFSDPPASRDFCIPLQKACQNGMLLQASIQAVRYSARQETVKMLASGQTVKLTYTLRWVGCMVTFSISGESCIPGSGQSLCGAERHQPAPRAARCSAVVSS